MNYPLDNHVEWFGPEEWQTHPPEQNIVVPLGLLIDCLTASIADPVIMPLWMAKRLIEAIPDDGGKGTDLRSELTQHMEGGVT